MDSSGAPYRGSHSTRLRFPDVRALNATQLVDSSSLASDAKTAPPWWRPRETVRVADLLAAPWLGWLFVYSFVQFFLSVTRCLTLKALVAMYGGPEDYTVAVKLAALSLGFLEDLVCTTFFASALWIFDTLKHSVAERFSQRGRSVEVAGGIATFVVSWLLFFGLVTPFVADMVLVRYRDMRFSFELLATLIRERKHLKAAPISRGEMHMAYATAAFLVVLSTLFALVRTWASWADLALWNPTQVVPSTASARTRSLKKASSGVKYVEVALEEGGPASPGKADTADKLSTPRKGVQEATNRRVLRAGIVLMGLVVAPAAAAGVCALCSPLVAYSALNATLNELLLHAFQPGSDFTTGRGGKWMERYIDSSEQHIRFGESTFYRRTTGFSGDLAFNVTVDNDNPPNVLVIGVESFRYRDSRYLVGDDDPSGLFKGTNLTVTPHFDRWAKRGVALRNIWSSIPTSRSLESLLFAQVPYQSNVKTGITGGKSSRACRSCSRRRGTVPSSRRGRRSLWTTGMRSSLPMGSTWCGRRSE
jgi:hypothetical protein